METTNQRIAMIVKQSGLNKTAFSEKINVSPSMVSLICSGKSGVSDRTIADICRVFGVNEVWLRTGEGEMKTPVSRGEEIAAIFAQLQASDDAKARLVKAFAKLPDEAYPVLAKYICQIAEELSKE